MKALGLRDLKPGPRAKKNDREAEAVEIIRAYQRGVSLSEIGRALGRTRMAMTYSVGVWALRNAIVKAPE